MKTVKEVDLDVILTELGDFGKFQIFIISILTLPNVIVAFYLLSYIFTASQLDYR